LLAEDENEDENDEKTGVLWRYKERASGARSF
jgi:hypothetical protein